MTMMFDATKLWRVLDQLGSAGHKVNYQRGKGAGEGKVGNLDIDVEKFIANNAGLDCSGYITYVIYQSTFSKVKITGGTMSQQEWLKKNGFNDYGSSLFVTAEDAYYTIAGSVDDRVRIGFRKTDLELKRQTSGSGSGQKGVGHVWLTINGKTYESTTKASNNGPASLPFSARTKDVDAYYLLGRAPGFGLKSRSITL